ncbi:hypothetical protein D3C86_1865450 [compost metagenome]
MDKGRKFHRPEVVGQGGLEKIGRGRTCLRGLRAKQVLGGVTLCIQVYDQGAQALAGADCREIAYNGRFSDPTLLIEHDAPHLPLWRESIRKRQHTSA